MLTGTPRVTKLRIEAQIAVPSKATALLIPALGNRNGNRTKVACAHPARPVPHHVKRAVGEDLEPQPTVPQLQQEYPEGPPRPAARDQPPPTLPLVPPVADRQPIAPHPRAPVVRAPLPGRPHPPPSIVLPRGVPQR